MSSAVTPHAALDLALGGSPALIPLSEELLCERNVFGSRGIPVRHDVAPVPVAEAKRSDGDR